jgi:hypothetical protein
MRCIKNRIWTFLLINFRHSSTLFSTLTCLIFIVFYIYLKVTAWESYKWKLILLLKINFFKLRGELAWHWNITAQSTCGEGNVALMESYDCGPGWHHWEWTTDASSSGKCDLYASLHEVSCQEWPTWFKGGLSIHPLVMDKQRLKNEQNSCTRKQADQPRWWGIQRNNWSLASKS